MDGKDSDMYMYFKYMLYKGFRAVLNHVEEIQLILNIMKYESDMACFEKFDLIQFRERFVENKNDSEVKIKYF